MSRLAVLSAFALLAAPHAASALRPGPIGCNNAPPEGRCMGSLLEYCDDTVEPTRLVSIDCTTEFGAGAQCILDNLNRAECAAALGGTCLRLDRGGSMVSINCIGNAAGCVEGQFSSACTEPLAACTAAEVGLCRGDQLVRGCRGDQPWLLDCPAFGAACSNGMCVGAQVGSLCGANVQCAAPNVCGRLSRCEAPPAPDAGMPSRDAATPDTGGAPDAAVIDTGVARDDAATDATDATAAQPDAAPADDATVARSDAATAIDASLAAADAGLLAETGEADDGCGCASTSASSSRPAAALLLGLMFLAVLRRRATD